MDDGGPAFPRPYSQHDDSTTHTDAFEEQRGMSLRDYFAAAALAGGLEQGVRDNLDVGWWRPAGDIAARAYRIADAMLAARSKSTVGK